MDELGIREVLSLLPEKAAAAVATLYALAWVAERAGRVWVRRGRRGRHVRAGEGSDVRLGPVERVQGIGHHRPLEHGISERGSESVAHEVAARGLDDPAAHTVEVAREQQIQPVVLDESLTE